MVVVGAGLAGVACARELRAAGVGVRLLDRGHVPGGRMASRTLWERRVDLGASYFTVSDDGFAAVVDDWDRRGLAREWTDTFTVLGDAERDSTSGPMRWGATHGLRSLVEDLATDLSVERRQVGSVERRQVGSVDDVEADVVVLAMPDPQARRLVGHHPVAASLDREWEPVIAVAARWADRTWDLDGAFVNGDPDLGWIADDGQRRGDGAPVLVAHTTPDLAARHLEEPAGVAPAAVQALRRLLDLGEPEDVHVHRWTFARPVGERTDPFALVDGDRLVGVCGDGWGPTPKVETAWLSGTRLGRALADRLR